MRIADLGLSKSRDPRIQGAGGPGRKAGATTARRTLYAAVCCLLFISAATPAGAWPFADYVIEYQPGPGQWVSNPQYNDPARALGRPYGVSAAIPDNTSLVTLGDHGYIVLGFNRPVWDDPRNPYGLDFIVFGNPAWVSGNPAYRWQEPAFVEISMDANGNGLADDEWFLLLPNKLPSELTGSPTQNPDTGHSQTVLRQYAEYTPTLALPSGKTPEEFYTVPDRWSYDGNADSLLIDEGSGGGDAFDIALAVKQVSPGVPTQPLVYAGIPCFNFVRITDAIAGDSAGILGEISAEIDAVADVSPLPGGGSTGNAKNQPDGAVVSLSDKVVSAILTGEIYVQEESRSSGIRVKTSDTAAEGDRVDVIGILSTWNGERFLDRGSVYVRSSGTSPKPLGMPAARVGGSALNPHTPGISGGKGLNNIGLLVQTWGNVKSVGADYFYLNDGSMPAASPGLKVYCGALGTPSTGQFALVAGASSCETEGSSTVALVKPRKQADIRVFTVP